MALLSPTLLTSGVIISLQVGRAALALFSLSFQHRSQKEEGSAQRLPTAGATPPAGPTPRVRSQPPKQQRLLEEVCFVPITLGG